MLAVAPLTSFTPDVLASELVRLRTDAHLSQRRLGNLADVSNTLISDLEAGSAPPPHPTTLMKLANGLATSGSGVLNDRKAEQDYLVLMQAAGYLPTEPDCHDTDEIRRAIIAEHVGPENADLAEAILLKMRDKHRRELEKVSEIVDILLGGLTQKRDN